MSIASRADENAALQALGQQGIKTLERLHDLHKWMSTTGSSKLSSTRRCSSVCRGSMAARSRSRSAWRVQEFQLVPPTLCSSNTKRTSTRTRRQTNPRKIITRPEVRTVDGDVIFGFRTREYEDLCFQVLQGLRFLNTLQSCDTLALSMDIFEP
ncbi:hypothetical protein PsorP6_012091 [Peronosclerospora sorghi]|uniref:Uncharacterized protein n=1 Tax=Peronosclerospora sorghi TaxID=230839 RepID=A0ACC0WHT7_9STRA|nr:hypothetical protein PsorP6_012091 [Peronosclerospora sorghi]